MKYEALLAEIMNEVGGAENVEDAYRCTTRLRFRLKDSARADLKKLGEIDGVMGAVETAGQTQVIIGQHVDEVYKELMATYPIEGGLRDAKEFKAEMSDKKVSSNVLDLIAGLFTPVLPFMTATGVIKGLLTLCTAMGWMQSTSGEYTFLYAIADSFFYFIPIFLVNPLVAREILGDGLLRNILKNNPVPLERAPIGMKASQVAAENCHAVGREQVGYAAKQLHVIALHIPGALAHAR